MHLKFDASTSSIPEALDFIEERLQAYGLRKKELTKARLISEETMMSLVSHSDGSGKSMTVSVHRWLGEIFVTLSASGNGYEFDSSLDIGVSLDSDELGESAEAALRGMILSSFVDDLKYRNQNGQNSVRITVARSNKKQLYYTILAMFLAIALGLLFKAVLPSSAVLFLSNNIFTPIKTMFMNALKMVVAPVVFFSIISAVGQFSNLSEVGKIGVKVIGLYLFTTVVASIIGILIGYFLTPQADGVSAVAAVEVASSTIDISIVDMIVNIVPSNFLSPFLNMDMLQLIFLAVFCGVATGALGSKGKLVGDIFSGLNDLFLKITTIIIKAMPVAVFSSIMALVLTTGIETLIPVVGMCAWFVIGLVAVMAVYILMLVVIAKLNPLPFMRKYGPVMAQVASTASSNAALPLNMSTCEKKLGISQKVYSLSLPLGATMNMDGTCIYLGVFALGLAKIYGVAVPSAALYSVAVSIIMLSIGAPGVSGAGLVCLSVLLTQLGVPVEALGLVMGIDPLIGMLRTMSNCLGDVVVSAIVAKGEKLLDRAVYNE